MSCRSATRRDDALSQVVTYDALLSLAHFGRALLVVADQRMRRGLPYGVATAPHPSTVQSTRRSSRSRRRRKNPTPGRPLAPAARAILNGGRKPGKQPPG